MIREPPEAVESMGLASRPMLAMVAAGGASGGGNEHKALPGDGAQAWTHLGSETTAQNLEEKFDEQNG
jgi:hypothetical protein